MVTTLAFVATGIALVVAAGLSAAATRRLARRRERALESARRVPSTRDTMSQEELLTRLRRQIVDEDALIEWNTIPYDNVSQLVRAYRALIAAVGQEMTRPALISDEQVSRRTLRFGILGEHEDLLPRSRAGWAGWTGNVSAERTPH